MKPYGFVFAGLIAILGFFGGSSLTHAADPSSSPELDASSNPEIEYQEDLASDSASVEKEAAIDPAETPLLQGTDLTLTLVEENTVQLKSQDLPESPDSPSEQGIEFAASIERTPENPPLNPGEIKDLLTNDGDEWADLERQFQEIISKILEITEELANTPPNEIEKIDRLKEQIQALRKQIQELDRKRLPLLKRQARFQRIIDKILGRPVKRDPTEITQDDVKALEKILEFLKREKEKKKENK